jgi:hypothetical protein
MGDKTKALVKSYEPTTRERTALDAHRDRRKRRSPAPRVKVSDNALSVDHADEVVGKTLLMEAIGTADQDFLDGFLVQLANVVTIGPNVTAHEVNFMLSIVKDIEPRDQVEAMLAAQMAATHNAIMTFARRLNHRENSPQQDSAERAFNKLARTFAAQVDTLKRYRGGEQTMRVENVTVNDGGQAIVGNVSGQKTDSTP